MDPYRSYRDMGCDGSSSQSGYRTREVLPTYGAYEASHSSRRLSSRPISPVGTSRFEREYVPPSMTQARIAERNAPVGLSSFYSRDPYDRRQPPRYGSSRSGGDTHSPSSRRPSTGSRGYGGVDLSSLGGGYDGTGYGSMYSSSRSGGNVLSRRPSYSTIASLHRSGSRNSGHQGASSSHLSVADVFGGPFGSPANMGSRYDQGCDREFTPSRSTRSSRDHSSGYDLLDSAAPRRQDSHRSSRSHRYY